MSELPAEVLEYIATLTPLPNGLPTGEQWAAVTKISRRLSELCGIEEARAVRAEAATRARDQMSPWPLAREEKG